MKILFINGPNLNMLGSRDPAKYGTDSLKDIEMKIGHLADKLKVEVEFFQSNHEGDIVGQIQIAADSSVEGIVINAGALTHYGISMRDALVDSKLPIIEVHLSNIHARESFRHKSVISDVAVGQIVGLGSRGYLFALEFLVEYLIKETSS
ncbi:MAG: type II 3-dehydroquinate dehydratase [Chloroflexota bacterium]|nr:type II 3-dehydroquinate dehydratase [Chloroflexota bacterium]